MSGTILTVVPPTTYDFGRLQTTAGLQQVVSIAQRIDASSWESATLRVRFHKFDTQIGGGNDYVQVVVASDGYTPDDPSTDFGNAGATLASVQVGPQSSSAIVLPSLAASSLTSVPSLVRVYVVAVRGASGTSTFAVKISVDLVFKTGGNARSSLGQIPGAFQGYAPGGQP